LNGIERKGEEVERGEEREERKETKGRREGGGKDRKRREGERRLPVDSLKVSHCVIQAPSAHYTDTVPDLHTHTHTHTHTHAQIGQIYQKRRMT
jgi:hypothetical protein